VSRIDEALGLSGVAAPARSAAATEQAVFQPAWPLAPIEGRGRAAGDDEAKVRTVGGRPVGFSSAWSDRLVTSPDTQPALVEQFRRLAGTLHKAQRLNGLRSVMVTSATPSDGKTLTAINLALVLSHSFNAEVLLVDADLRRPSIPSVVDFTQEAGLSEALCARQPQRLALVRIAPKLTLLPAGQPISNSIEALTSPRMKHILDGAADHYDWVILDAPPVGITTDARLLAEFVGGALFVIRAGVSQHDDVTQAIAALGREQILGVVLNGSQQPIKEMAYYAPIKPGRKP
jgi:protein-tyrosine kinase